MGLFNLFKKEKQNPLAPNNNLPPTAEPDRSKWTGKDFEFLITGDLEITAENHDQIMTPNSFEWINLKLKVTPLSTSAHPEPWIITNC